MIRAVLLVTFLTTLSYASSPVSGCLSGKTLSPNQEAIGGVTVAIREVDRPHVSDVAYLVQSDSHGHFLTDGIRPGRYEVAPVRAASPYPPGWPQNETSPGAQVVVSASQHCADVVVPIHARVARLKVAAVDAVTQKPISHFSLIFRNDTYPALWYSAPDAAQRELLVLSGTQITVAIYAPGYHRTYSKELKPLAAGTRQELTFELHPDPDQLRSRSD